MKHRSESDRGWLKVVEKKGYHVRGEACAGPGRERERCICIMAPSVEGCAISS